MSVASGTDNKYTYEKFLSIHRNQLENSCVPQIYWETLHVKLKNEVFDAGLHFQILCVEEETDDDEGEVSEQEHSWRVVVTDDDGISCSDPNHIYLIDHAWSCRVHESRGFLTELPQLLQRMANMMEVKVEGRDTDEVIDEVLREMWCYNQTYSIGNFKLGLDVSLPIWYIMDEFGSRIQHSDTPTFKTAPFFYGPSDMTFTIMWPVQDIDCEDEVTRDYVPNTTDPERRKAQLLPWQYSDFRDVSFEQSEPPEEFFGAHRMNEEEGNEDVVFPDLPTNRKVKVFLRHENLPPLTDERFELVDDENEADILWISKHFKDFRHLTREKCGVFINQFPYEHVITVKDILVAVCRRTASKNINPDTLAGRPKWLPVSYNLKTEMPQFVSYFQHREDKGLDNSWVIKPWNLNNSIDMCATDNLNQILRLSETGPKLASKYVTDLVTIYYKELGANVKFDIRYEILLRSVDPLKIYVHKKFYARTGTKAFDMKGKLDDMAIHFTNLMMYEGFNVYRVTADELIAQFGILYPEFSWNTVEESIYEMIVEVFEAATARPPPAGLKHFPMSRALYGMDVMLQWDTNDRGERYIQPVLMEVNFNPNLKGHQTTNPHITNDIFSTLFFDDIDGRDVVQIK